MSWLRDSLREFFRKGDLVLLSLCVAASAYGLVLIYSATRYLESNRNVIVQSVAIVLGILVYIALSSVDFELLTEKSWKLLLAFNVVFNACSPSPRWAWSATATGAGWASRAFPVNIQPAEITKLTFVLLLAWQCIKLRDRGISRPSSVFQLAGHTVLLCGIITVASGDFGMAFTYLFIFVIMAWSAGVQKRWFLLAAVLVVAAILLIWPHVSDDYRFQRFTVVVDHLTGNEETIYQQTQGVGYQQTRSLLAIGSGGLFGMGYLQGVQTQSSSTVSLIARETDSIFAVCGEELGLVGCLLVLLLLAAIILRCIWVLPPAPAAPSPPSSAMGFAGMLLVQTAVNVGMCLPISSPSSA